MIARHWIAIFLVATWAALVAAGLALRPPLPVDETRYLGVAWEMFNGGGALVPRLNGEPYPHKPPLLFWLIDLSWLVLGANGLSARLIAPLFALANLFLAAALARRLWPQHPAVARFAPILLLGTGVWAVISTMTMFDMLVAFAVLVAMIGLVEAARAPRTRRSLLGGFALFGLGIGLGVLAKGPVALAFALPPALFARWWLPAGGPGADRGWFLGVAGGVGLGAALALAWAVPAAIVAGPAFRDAIFWGQTAGRAVDSFAHGRPFWWYFVVLPLAFLPWTIWPPVWRRAGWLDILRGDRGVRLAAIWLAGSVVVLSLFSGKQVHYLVPAFPAFALIVGRMLALEDLTPRAWDLAVPGVVVAVLGFALLVAPGLAGTRGLPAWLAGLPALWGAVPIVAAAGVMFFWLPGALHRAAALAALVAVLVVSVHFLARPRLAEAYDLGPVAGRLGTWQRAGFALAFLGSYHGQFQFLGRLGAPIAEIEVADLEVWLATHRNGKLVSVQEGLVAGRLRPDLVQPYRNRLLTVWDAEVARSDPRVVLP
ncbi:MAG: glycosyltransferase family 39 protein [Proteobacteria bacterium]|nr:glycosyltransferase family 39 protein [Pseudomonadota bacterium]